MEDLLDEYKGSPVEYDDADDNEALIIHTSGTTSGIHKPIPLSDRGLNESVARLLRDERFEDLRGSAVTCINMDLTGSYSMIDMLHLPLAFGGRVNTLPFTGFGPLYCRAVTECGTNTLFGPMMFDIWSRLPIRIDLSALKMVFLGGPYVSAASKIGQGLGNSLFGFVLAAAGFNAALDGQGIAQPAPVLSMTAFTYIWVPMICYLIVFFFLLFSFFFKYG